MKKMDGGFYSTTETKEIEKDIFKDIELRLKLRSLLARRKVEQYAKLTPSEENELSNFEKEKEKTKILNRLTNSI
jgi:hypothetical protein